jgi:hypothetical protein
MEREKLGWIAIGALHVGAALLLACAGIVAAGSATSLPTGHQVVVAGIRG